MAQHISNQAPQPPSDPPPPPPPTDAVKPTADSVLDIDLDFIAFDIPVAGPSRFPLPSRPESTVSGYHSPSLALSTGPSTSASTPIGNGSLPRRTARESSQKKGKKRSIEEVDYGRDSYSRDNTADEDDGSGDDFDDQLDIDPKEEKLIARLRARGTPWMQGFDWRRCTTGTNMLNEEALAFWNYIRPTQIEHNVRGYIIDVIAENIKRVWKDSKLHVFGSYRTGLYLPYGDIDLVIESKSLSSQPPRRQIEQLAHVIRNSGITTSVQAIAHAKVPIVKFKTIKGGFPVDVSIGQLNGVQSGHIIRGYFQALPAMQPLIYLVKHFLWQRSLNEVFTGGLGSYATICLVISFLQMHPKLRRNEIDPMKHLGQLFMEFFELYGSRFNSEHVGISLRDGGQYFSKQGRGWVSGGQYGSNRDQRQKFSIEDPQDITNDISRGTFAMTRLRGAFNSAFERLSARMSRVAQEEPRFKQIQFGYMSGPHPWVDEQGNARDSKITILGCVLGLDDEIIHHRLEIAELYHRGLLQRQLRIAQDAFPSFFNTIGDAAWVQELASPLNGHDQYAVVSEAPPSVGPAARTVTAIMLEDDAAPVAGQSSTNLEYFSDSGTDEEDVRVTKRVASASESVASTIPKESNKSNKSNKSQRKRKMVKRMDQDEEADQSRYAIGGRMSSRRSNGTSDSREVIQISDSDSDSVEMDIVDDESVDEGQIGPEDYAAARDEAPQNRSGQQASTGRPIAGLPSTKSPSEQPRKPFLPSTAKPIEAFSHAQALHSASPAPQPVKSITVFGRASQVNGTPTPASKNQKGPNSSGKKVKPSEKRAYWDAKKSVEPGLAQGSSKGKGGKRSGQNSRNGSAGGQEEFASNADFISL